MFTPFFAARAGVAMTVVLAMSVANEFLRTDCARIAFTDTVEQLLGEGYNSHSQPTIVVPSNFAASRPPDGDGGAMSGWVPVGELGIVRPAVPFPADLQMRVGSWDVVTSGAVDVAPPTGVNHASGTNHPPDLGCTCGAPSCGPHSYSTIDFTPATDELTSSNQVTYALFVGATADEAMTAPTPIRLYVDAASGHIVDGLDVFGQPESKFISLAAIDQAGNIGPRSPASQVRRD